MRIVFGVIGVLTLVISLVSCMAAKTAIHETASIVTALVGFLALGVAAILSELQQFRQTMV